MCVYLCNVLHFMKVILNTNQEQHLQQVADAGRTLAIAKRAARAATDDVKDAVHAALDANVPLSRVARAAQVERSLIYHWLGQEEAAAA